MAWLESGQPHGRPRHFRASGPTHARPSAFTPKRRLLTFGGLTAAGISATIVIVTVYGGQGAAGRQALGAGGAVGRLAPQVDLAAQAGGDGPLLSAADLAAMRGTRGAARLAGRVAPRRDLAPESALAADGIPSTALAAYQQAAQYEAQVNPGCGLPWPLLAGIGRVESDHGRFAGATLHADGLSTPPVIGIPLNGHGTALIRDTDHGRLDGDPVYDRAVGPMQFIPSTWAKWGVDANNDGVRDPFNIFDAAEAAANYLCAAGRDLTTAHGQVQAILSYNYSYDYVSMVMGVERVYATQLGISVPVLPTSTEPPSGPPKQKPPLPPVDPGKPRGAQPPPTTTPTPAPDSSSSTTPGPPSSSEQVPSPSGSSSDSPTPTDPGPAPSTDTPTPTDSPTATSSAAAPPPAGNTGTGNTATP